jgi:diaminohydroxyphosphoribosylaminopyrimidine deaminase/5-amino-6-(5-phosphoribosylamino)uracil reductase
MDQAITAQDLLFMKKALRLASKGAGRTSPNPMVGAVVVRDNEVVGEGYHRFVGGPHAEVNAIEAAGDRTPGAVLYVTLEPCNHQGRTPPCTRSILDAGIARVVVGMNDPNPRVCGGGADHLRQRGIVVDSGALERECRLLNQPFIKHVSTGLPYVTVKAATTLDGRIATSSGHSQWISNEQSRRHAHQLRCNLDGILVGIETALSDDPLLTARLPGRRNCRQPVRILLDSRLRIPMNSRLVRTAREVPFWIACSLEADEKKERKLAEAGVNILRLPAKNHRIDLVGLLRELGKRQITSLLVEGGASVLGALIEEGLADDFCFFYAPKILGDPEGIPLVRGRPREKMTEALPVYDVKVRRFGADVMLTGRFRETIY